MWNIFIYKEIYNIYKKMYKEIVWRKRTIIDDYL